MRIIKFRAWLKDSHTMIDLGTCGPIEFDDEDAKLVFGKDFHDDFTDSSTRNFELLQFTGLQDSNGKDIYEGDIVKCPGYPRRGTVVWHDSTAGFIVMERNDKRAHGLCDIWEVTGNIYEHPDLLK